MSDNFDFSTGRPSDEMADYLQMYLDETAEQLDGLVDTLLVLETVPGDAEQLNEAFRLVHSIKGSSALMGLDSVTVLTHRLENYFERLRSGIARLERPMMDLILRCIDFLRDCNRRLREGQPLTSAPQLMEELDKLNVSPPVAAGAAPAIGMSSHGGSPNAAAPVATAPVAAAPVAAAPVAAAPVAAAPVAAAPVAAAPVAPPPLLEYRVAVRFETDLPLADLKAELVLARVAEIATVYKMHPERDELANIAEVRWLQLHVATHHSPHELRVAADAAGVELVEIEEGVTEFTLPDSLNGAPEASAPTSVAEPPLAESAPVVAPEAVAAPAPSPIFPPTPAAPAAAVATVASGLTLDDVAQRDVPEQNDEAAASPTAVDAPEAKAKLAETVRVDIDRLDNLMNLAGELVVNKARFVQLARQMSPAFRKSSLASRTRAFGETMRRTILAMKNHQEQGRNDEEMLRWSEQLCELESELDVIEEQSRVWEESRRCFSQITEAIDQLTRVSDSLQRGVLDTRMVPVAPLFNRFKRVVRDISLELKKRIHLDIHGEKTELDKRMIDELGDPLVHLVRNAIDHGIESAEVRAARGKPEIGTVRLEASHSGNNVFITISDDGGGIQIEKVRRRVVERGLLAESAAAELSPHDLAEYIWHPGFSTAEVVSDISGRGVGMDIVKTRIAELNGTIDIDFIEGQGTTFTIRLPLTLAIIRSLLFRLRHGVFAVPIDNVREIVSVPLDQIVKIHGRRTFDVRGEFIPLVDIDDVFDWHALMYDYKGYRGKAAEADGKRVDVVVLHTANKTMGLCVDELHGGQDIVIKSLAENFVHIRGLSGASILGDGSVCLLLDVGAAIDLASVTKSKARTLVTV